MTIIFTQTNPPPPECKNVLNVFFHYITFDSYCKKASDALGISFKPNVVYKICDLKPFYPLIHKEEMGDYEFIGFGDIDIILGNISEYLENRLDRIDFYSAHADRVSGHFCFMRNNEVFRNKAFLIPNWEKYLTDKKHYGIDEGAFCDVVAKPLGLARRIWHRIVPHNSMNIQWRTLRLLAYIASVFVPSRLCFEELHSTHCAIPPDILKYKWTDTEWIYDGNEIRGVHNNRTYPYLHFLFLKKNDYITFSSWGDDFYKVTNPNGKILITRNGIINC